jgi:hypothetical protein
VQLTRSLSPNPCRGALTQCLNGGEADVRHVRTGSRTPWRIEAWASSPHRRACLQPIEAR